MDTVSYTEKMMGFDYCEDYLRSTSKYFYGSVKKRKCPFSCHLQINKNIKNVTKNDPRGETDSNFAYEVLVRRNLI